MPLNIELAEEVLAQITEHPESHDQLTWGIRATGQPETTRMCVGGWALMLGGAARWSDWGYMEHVGLMQNCTPVLTAANLLGVSALWMNTVAGSNNATARQMLESAIMQAKQANSPVRECVRELVLA